MDHRAKMDCLGWQICIEPLIKAPILATSCYVINRIPSNVSQMIWLSQCSRTSGRDKGDLKSLSMGIILLMEEILRQLIGSLSQLFTGFYTCQVVQDFFHQQYFLGKGAFDGVSTSPHEHFCSIL